MPRNVRNFWIEAEVDGKKTPVATGPRSKDGGFTLRVYMRDKGMVAQPMIIVGRAYANGELILNVYDPHSGDVVHQTKTER